MTLTLTQSQQRSYAEDGFLFLPGCFSQSEVDVLKRQLPDVFARNNQMRVTENDERIVRSVYGSHTKNQVFEKLTKHPRLVQPSKQLLGSDVYIYQFKINAKAAFGGDLWEWHQDYTFWNREDGMPSPRAMSAMLFVDEVNEFNGPLFLIPGSHKEGIIDCAKRSNGNGHGMGAANGDPAWTSSVTAKLKYALDRETLGRLAGSYGMVAPKGPAGSVLFFDSSIVHGSANNISPFDRVVVIVTFNSTENIPDKALSSRPEFLSSEDYTSIVALPDNALFL